jgi:hypothetical protein
MKQCTRGTHPLLRAEQARDLSGWGNKLSKKGALTLYQGQGKLERVARKVKESLQAGGIHLLPSAKHRSYQDSEIKVEGPVKKQSESVVRTAKESQ